MPDFLIALVSQVVGIEVLSVELAPLVCTPCGEVNTVGNIANVALLGIVAVPDASKHLLADLAVQPANAVNLLTGVASEGRHTEALALVVGIHAAHADELVPRNAQELGITAHVLREQLLVEVVVTSGNGSVNGVERAYANQLESLGEAETFLNVVNQALYVAQSCVTLVAVVNVLLDTELLEQQNTTDTEQDLLLQTVLPVTTIKSVGDGTVELAVHLVVGVEQVELNTANVYTPYVCVNIIVHVRNVNYHGSAVSVHLLLDGQRTEVLCLIVSNLLTIHAQSLSEVAVTIQETNSAHVYVAVRSLLDVVTGQDTKTTRVDLQHLVQTVLHAKVCNRGTILVGLYVHVLTELSVHVVHLLHDSLVLSQLLHLLVRKTLQQENRVLAALCIQLGIQAGKQAASIVIPSPPHVVCELIQLLQLSGDAALCRDASPSCCIGVACFNSHNFVC